MPSPKAPSEKLIARRAAKVVLNHAALDEISRAAVDGFFEFAKSILTSADVPDATPYGEGLIDHGGAIAYVGKQLVASYAMNPGDPTVKKPRGAKLGPGVVVIAGYGFPARFQEAGTIHQPARPFLTPELMQQQPDAGGYIQKAMIKHKVISVRRAAARAAEAAGPIGAA